MQKNTRRRGRPQKSQEELREATNISLSPQLKRQAKHIAKQRRISFSELVETSLIREVGGNYHTRPSYYEFFAGGGMARVGLGPGWICRLANDFSERKQSSYMRNHGGKHFVPGCISEIEPGQLPGKADLAWASFPCQDLSLAGNRRGLHAERSGAFWPFWSLMAQLAGENRAPRLIAMENVPGLLTTGGGCDFAAIIHALACEGYRTGAIILDASEFVPQSRKRIFIVSVGPGEMIPEELLEAFPSDYWHPAAMRKSVNQFTELAKRHWVWLSPRRPQCSRRSLLDVLEDPPCGVEWHDPSQTSKLLGMMTRVNRSKIEVARATGRLAVGCLYKRTRTDPNGKRVQRAEVRFDLAGCLRTPGGGSSRQTIVVVRDGQIRTRLISPREGARLMGLPDDYQLPENYNDAYHLVGDGVVVPAVAFLRKTVLEPILKRDTASAVGAA